MPDFQFIKNSKLSWIVDLFFSPGRQLLIKAAKLLQALYLKMQAHTSGAWMDALIKGSYDGL